MGDSQFKIAIIGAGPAGLTLGHLLLKHNVPFQIFELRQKPPADELAKPSGMLDMHEDSGIAAMKECGLWDQLEKLTGECSEAHKVLNKDGDILYADNGDERGRPEVSRHGFTNLLISHLPDNVIKWDYKLLAAKALPSEAVSQTVELDFGPRGRQTFDLVVGADGAWSRVRNVVTDVKPHYADTQLITVTIREISKKYPHLAELVGPGSLTALGNRNGLMSQRGPQDSARLYLIISTHDEQFATSYGLSGQLPKAAKERLLEDAGLFGTWNARLKELVAAACDEQQLDDPNVAIDIRPMHKLPVGHTWKHRSGVTLIGDAAHLMCPWAGEGVNVAMADALSLANAIAKARDEAVPDNVMSFQQALNSRIEAFEKEMLERATEKAEETVRNGEMLFGEDGASAFANFFLSMGPPPS